MLVALTNGDVILIVVFVAIPVAGIAFAVGSGGAFKSIGKGGLSVEMDSDYGEGMRDSSAEIGSMDAAPVRLPLRTKHA